MACPKCGSRSKRVDGVTVKSLVRHLRFGSPVAPYYLCATKGCDVVYFSANLDAPVYRHADLLVSVGVKQEDDAALVCYCFGVTRGQVREEVRRDGVSSSAARIKAEVKAGRCACELKNPSGKCCLGEVVRAVEEALHCSAAI